MSWYRQGRGSVPSISMLQVRTWVRVRIRSITRDAMP